MSRRALQKKAELLRETAVVNMALARSELLNSGLLEAAEIAGALIEVEKELRRSVSGQTAILESIAKRHPERSRPHFADKTLYLPRAAEDHAPMMRAALQVAFPMHYPQKAVRGLAVARVELAGQTVEFRMAGTGLSQDELDVLLAALHFAEGRCDCPVTVSSWQMLRLLGRSTNARNARTLADQLLRLREQLFYAVDKDEHVLTGKWTILCDMSTSGEQSRHALTYAIDRRFAAMFLSGFAAWCPVDLALRRKLDTRAKLARWLHAYLSSYPVKHHRYVDDLHALSGAIRADERRFRHELREACRQLEALGFLEAGTSRCEMSERGRYVLRTVKATRRAKLPLPHAARSVALPETLSTVLELSAGDADGTT